MADVNLPAVPTRSSRREPGLLQALGISVVLTALPLRRPRAGWERCNPAQEKHQRPELPPDWKGRNQAPDPAQPPRAAEPQQRSSPPPSGSLPALGGGAWARAEHAQQRAHRAHGDARAHPHGMDGWRWRAQSSRGFPQGFVVSRNSPSQGEK